MHKNHNAAQQPTQRRARLSQARTPLSAATAQRAGHRTGSTSPRRRAARTPPSPPPRPALAGQRLLARRTR
jgi:hypothetical protein